MTQVIFNFDTEDYVNPQGADGILRASKIVREAGVRPCHNVVGWIALALEKWGRQDVIDEIKKCEISTHSLKHSYHPNICEMTDLEDFDEASRRLKKEEAECLDILERVFGTNEFVAACSPGESYSYVAQYAYADMGIPIYNANWTHDALKNRPVSYCNMLSLKYNISLDYIGLLTKEQILELIDSFSSNDILTFYHHPAMNTVDEFPDVLNFMYENRKGDWLLSNPRPAEFTQKFEENLRFLLDTLKNDDRFEFTTYRDIAERYIKGRTVKPDSIAQLKKALDEEFFPVTCPDSLSLADIMLACRDFLLGKEEHICSKVYGFLDTPYAIPQPVKVTLEEMRASENQIHDGEFLPTEILVGDKKLGPADWLRAALDVLTGNQETIVYPDKWQIDLSQFPVLATQTFKDVWLHSKSLEDKYLSNRARLQAWTIRLPKGSSRKIF